MSQMGPKNLHIPFQTLIDVLPFLIYWTQYPNQRTHAGLSTTIFALVGMPSQPVSRGSMSRKHRRPAGKVRLAGSWQYTPVKLRRDAVYCLEDGKAISVY